MAKKLLFDEDECVLQLSGWQRFASLKKQIRIPYKSIKCASIQSFKIPFWAVRMPGFALPLFNHYQGTFFHKKTKYFVSCESNSPQVVIQCSKDYQYQYVCSL